MGLSNVDLEGGEAVKEPIQDHLHRIQPAHAVEPRYLLGEAYRANFFERLWLFPRILQQGTRALSKAIEFNVYRDRHLHI